MGTCYCCRESRVNVDSQWQVVSSHRLLPRSHLPVIISPLVFFLISVLHTDKFTGQCFSNEYFEWMVGGQLSPCDSMLHLNCLLVIWLSFISVPNLVQPWVQAWIIGPGLACVIFGPTCVSNLVSMSVLALCIDSLTQHSFQQKFRLQFVWVMLFNIGWISVALSVIRNTRPDIVLWVPDIVLLPSIDIWHLFGLISRIPGLLYGFFLCFSFFLVF